MLGDARMRSSLFTCVPNGLVGYGTILITSTYAAGEQIDPRFLPAPIFTQGLQQSRAEWQVSTGSALAALHADHHAPTVDIAHLEHRYFCPPHARAVKRHQESPLHQVAGAIDEAADFLQAQHGRQSTMGFRIGQLFPEVTSLECANEKESERSNAGHHARHRQLPLNQKIGLVASEIIRP